ncbi:MAG: hypothetical protein LUM44_15135 [Pyrinomonadaceae bacterium]|nr:hypothetical protein [Pyrinomonadaceae bacterium]
MRSKTILSIAAFIVAFGFSVFLASLFMTKPLQTVFVSSDYGSRPTSCFKERFMSREARSISAFLRQDISNGRERDRDIYKLRVGTRTPFGETAFDDYAVIIDEYVNEANNLNANDLPQDFQEKWEKHLKAWQDYAEFLNDLKGENVKSSERILRQDGQFNKEIDATWYEVLRVGKTYGANN